MKKLYLTTKAQLEPRDYKSPKTEEEILEQVIIPGENDEFILVKGSSGTGKSHLIRWFYDKLRGMDLDREAILFIKRDNNTLKGTLQQLINIPEVKNLPNKDQYKKLLNAAQSVPEVELKETIYYNYLIKIDSDKDGTGENGEERLISNLRRKNLLALMKDDIFKAKLMEVDGPIDRIYSKFAGEAGAGDVDARFLRQDFLIDDDLVETIDNSGTSRNAQRMAADLWSEQGAQNYELTDEIVKYLNTFNDGVIQRCSGLEAGDLKEVFTEIRKELARNDKNLTLLIEDISSFTGVNAALMDALTTRHTGMYEQQRICRVNAIVGCTEGYYRDFRDNYKERIDYFITVPDEAFDANSDELIEFFAKYLNTVSLDHLTLHEWLESGADEQNCPIHNDTMGKFWDVYRMPNGGEINLFPFTKAAIKHLYEAQDENSRKPRTLITQILLPYIVDAFGDLNQFPEDTGRSQTAFTEPKLIASVNNVVRDHDLFSRMIRFMSIWGNGKNEKILRSGITYISGIRTELFEQLSMPVIQIGEIKKPISNAPEGQSPIENGNGQDGDKIVPVPAAKKQDPRVEKAQQTLKSWTISSREELVVNTTAGDNEVFNYARREMSNFLLDSIDWDAEAISADSLSKFKKSSNNNSKWLIGFERQRGGGSPITLPAVYDTAQVIECFVRKDLEGKGTWNFPGGNDYLLQAEEWAFSLKSKAIELVKSYSVKAEDGIETVKKVDYFKYAAIADIYRLIVCGECQNNNDVTTIPASRLLQPFPGVTEIYSLTNALGHTAAWAGLTRMLTGQDAAANHETVLNYYNLPQGTKSNSKNYEIDYLSFNKAVHEALRTRLVVSPEQLQSDDPNKNRSKSSEYLDKIMARIPAVVESEKDEIRRKLEIINQNIDLSTAKEEEDISDAIASTLKQARNFLNTAAECKISLNMASRENAMKAVSSLLQIMKKSKNMQQSITLGKSVLEEPDNVKALLLLSRNPLRLLAQLADTLQSIQKLLETAKISVAAKKAKLNIDDSQMQFSLQEQKNEICECLDILEEVKPHAD